MRKKIEPLFVTFWGTRGSIPTPGPSTLKYGGNTSCVEVRYRDHSLILDGGTGLRELGLNQERKNNRQSVLLITHAHQDHIAGIPFYGPALQRTHRLLILGPPGLKTALVQLFPFAVLPSRREVKEIRPSRFRIGPFQISCRWLNHPGLALGYQISTPAKTTVVYLSDHEPTPLYRHNHLISSDRDLLTWIQKTDLLIMDAQYFDADYPDRKSWGHSSLSHTVHFALAGKAKQLVLFHHDPMDSDSKLEKKLRMARTLIVQSGHSLPCRLAREGERLVI